MSQKPPRTLRLGVTGHRLDKLDGAAIARLKPAVGQAVARVARVAGRSAASLQVVSPLAEGADRLVASAALEQSAELVAALPFPRDAYRDDFADPASKAEFDALLSQAAAVVELPGERRDAAARAAAYAAVGRRVVDDSDMLIAIWNGDSPEGRGGTAEIVAYAGRCGRPVLWFPTVAAAEPQLLMAGVPVDAHALDAFADEAAAILAGKLEAAR
jgi:hypothetical protein